MERVGVYFGHYPAGTSIYSWTQVKNSFYTTDRNYLEVDFGIQRNLKIYGQEVPPQVDPSKIKDAGVPIAVYVGKQDLMVCTEHAKIFREDAGDAIIDFHAITGGHLTFLVGKDTFFQDRALPLIQKYNPVKN